MGVQQFGFRAVIAPSFGDIFRNNCFQNGFFRSGARPDGARDHRPRYQRAGLPITIDLEQQTVADDRDTLASFDIDPSVKHRLLNGLDDIGLTLQHSDEIAEFEQTRRPAYLPTTLEGAGV